MAPHVKLNETHFIKQPTDRQVRKQNNVPSGLCPSGKSYGHVLYSDWAGVG